VLRHRPEGEPKSGDLEFVEAPVRELREGEILVRNLYLSLDPTHRLWMSEREQYLPPVKLGGVMRGGVIGVVEASCSDRFARGQIVSPGLAGWELYSIAREDSLHAVLTQPDIPLTAHLSVLGATGLTAYFGLLDVGRPQAGETVVVSAAAGAVGSIAGQIARLKGCRVVGIAGGPGKCRWLTQSLAFDGAIDYKCEDVPAALDRLCPNGVDVDFENVGGAIMDAVFERMNQRGRMVVCGLISTYNRTGPMPGPIDFSRVLMRRLTIRGFIVIDYLARAREAIKDLTSWIAEGKLQWKTQIVDGLEQAPEALNRLFTGDHDGKLLVRISPEP
jgi:NADPH-dependent curcumin reductase CurA